ncbi:MAG: hypothetical protein AB7P94_16680 [Steroidobacteraceae bacterium]
MKKTHNRRADPLLRKTLTPVERAVLRQKWSHQAVDAQLHALMGDSVEAIADRAGALFYVVLWACHRDQLPTDDVDRRIVRGAVMQLADLDGKTRINDMQRGAVRSGLEAMARLAPRLKADTMALASHSLYYIARERPVVLRDFPPVDFPAAHNPEARKDANP